MFVVVFVHYRLLGLVRQFLAQMLCVFARDTAHVVQWFAFSCAQTVSGLVEGSPGCAILPD